jgi:hypothetical protein
MAWSEPLLQRPVFDPRSLERAAPVFAQLRALGQNRTLAYLAQRLYMKRLRALDFGCEALLRMSCLVRHAACLGMLPGRGCQERVVKLLIMPVAWGIAAGKQVPV